MEKKKITKNTKLGEIMKINPEAGMILFEYGLHCIGCGLASMETLEQGCLAHGMSKKEIQEIIDRLNGKKENEHSRVYTQKGHENLSRGPEKSSTKIFTKGKKIGKKIKKLPNKKISANKLKEMLE